MREMIKCSSNPCTYYGSIYYTTILVREFVDWFPPKNIMYNGEKSLPYVGDSLYSNYLLVLVGYNCQIGSALNRVGGCSIRSLL